MGSLDGKVAIVTGGTRGIGKGIVQHFVKQGAKVVFSYRSSSTEADALVSELGADIALAVQSDAAVMADAQALVQQALDAHGRIDILINNAGITKDNLMLRMSEEQWDGVIQVNLKSVFNLTKSVLRTMLAEEWFHHQHGISRGHIWQCWSSKLRGVKSRYYWIYQVNR